MRIEMRPITDIRPYENNPRINDDAVDALIEAAYEARTRSRARKAAL